MGFDWSQWRDRLPFPGRKGEEVAPRPLSLKLDVPVMRTGSRRSPQKVEPPAEHWRELNKHPTELLREIDRYLHRLNTERIRETRRIAWLEQALQYACPAMRKIYSEHYKADALPESHDRREGLVAAVNVCGQLAAGYKRQLNQDFALPDARYGRVRSRVCLHALRILELIRMEQRLRAMRYQRLPTKVWQDANQIFFAVSQCEDIDRQYPALNCLQVSLDNPAHEVEHRAPATTSLNRVYLFIQLNGLFDINTISCRKLHVVDTQIARVIDSITIIPDHGRELGRGKLLVYHGQDCPAYFVRKDTQQRKKSIAWLKVKGEISDEDGLSMNYKLKAIIIDVAPLDALLMNEHQQLLERFESGVENEDEQAASAETVKNKYSVVTDQDDLAKLLTIDAMCDGLHLKQRKEKREYILGQKVLYLYNGFMSVYKLLVDMATEEGEENPELVADSELRDALAGRSALIAADLEASEYGQWFVVDKSAGGVHIKTQESEFTTALFIGQVVVFAYSREELDKPILGYVVRLRRATGKEIEVTIRILSQDVMATAVQSEFLSKNDMALPAILLDGGQQDAATEAGCRLMLHHSHRLSPGTTVNIELGQKQQGNIIAEMTKIQREFVIYSLENAGQG